MDKIPLTKTDLENHFQEQIEFLKHSCDSFDNRFYSEAKRIAVVLRVLLHDTGNSHSLMGQLDKKDIKFFNTSFPLDKNNLSTHGGLVMMAAKGKESKFIPMLDDAHFKRWNSFNDWWNEDVFVDDEKKVLKRKDLILISANQDGGAHVDPNLNRTYSRLSNDESLGLTYHVGDSEIKIPKATGSAIRQIAHELLKTIFPDYNKMQEESADMFISTGALVEDTKPSSIPIYKNNSSCSFCFSQSR